MRWRRFVLTVRWCALEKWWRGVDQIDGSRKWNSVVQLASFQLFIDDLNDGPTPRPTLDHGLENEASENYRVHLLRMLKKFGGVWASAVNIQWGDMDNQSPRHGYAHIFNLFSYYYFFFFTWTVYVCNILFPFFISRLYWTVYSSAKKGWVKKKIVG